jgi:hypothetical protein
MKYIKSHIDFLNEKNDIVEFIYLDHYSQMKPKGFVKKLISSIYKRNYIKKNPANDKVLHGVTDKELKALNKFKRGG